MNLDFLFDGQVLLIKLAGEIDHHNAKLIREKIDFEITKVRPKLLILDFNMISFMDSSGIGLIMGRYAILSKMGAKIEVINVSKNIYRVMLLSKLTTIAKITQRGCV